MKKKSLLLAGHATSLALEREFWAAIEREAEQRGVSVPALIKSIDETRGERPLASACRVAALGWAEKARE